ncbi:sugar ABC transporter substrate-binding protein [Fervidicella metallireducens AeB]|uniref:Sugar ABC transporter substrate-binding protein n=1 Tax=Fervidicella metallireducens AeB TaxID=1403537 RepID=A0A017RVS5_9CLOT|nr:substrate-binding domain-containing protein [Fervidicella metallireducens]EYE88706.1 sugar ABC transporter substrate-binding protein [Fervidicella metallireducens AeB]
MVKDKVLKNSLIAALSIVLIIQIALILIKIDKPTVSLSKTQDVNLREEKKIKIGFSLGTLKEERWIKDRDILMTKARESGAEIIIQNANNDDQDQLKQVRYLINQDIDVLLLVPNDYSKAAAAVDMAKERGIPVISYDRLVLNSNVDLYISFDNVKVGELMARGILNKIKSGNVLIINGAQNDNNTRMIKEGYDKILKPFVESGKINIVAEEWAPNWLKEYAFNIVDKELQKRTKLNAVIAGNDSLAEGAIEALSEHRLIGKVHVVGQDADLWACQRIVEGTQVTTIYKPIDKLADAAIELAIKLVKKEPVNIEKRIFDGKYYVPYYVLEPIAVDKSNIDITIIKDGFHLKDEVYRK